MAISSRITRHKAQIFLEHDNEFTKQSPDLNPLEQLLWDVLEWVIHIMDA